MSDVHRTEEWASWRLFHLAVVLTLLLGPIVSLLFSAVFVGTGGNDDPLLFLLQAVGGILLLQFTIGLLLVIPTYAAGVFLGFPAWCFMMNALRNRGVSWGMSMFFSAILVTYLISISADLVIYLMSENPLSLQFPITKVFAPGAALVAVVSTQFLMVPAE